LRRRETTKLHVVVALVKSAEAPTTALHRVRSARALLACLALKDCHCQKRSVGFFCLTRAELGKWRAARDSNPQPPDP
jgi:hypothetical protein